MNDYAPPVPGLEFLARFEVELDQSKSWRDWKSANAALFHYRSKFAGPRMKGRVHPGGADGSLCKMMGARVDTVIA